MLHGVCARFYPGTIVCLSGIEHESYADELAELLRFEEPKSKWLIKLCHPRFDGRKILVCESAFNLVYCVLPANASSNAVEYYGKQVSVVPQNELGRGLVTLDPCPAGEALFAEPPFFITASGVEAMWQARWHAYVRLYDEADNNEVVKVALDAFDSLSCGGTWVDWRQDIKGAAESVAKSSGYRDTLDDGSFYEVLDRITQVLLKVRANQFEFSDGTPFESSALYRQTLLMNHSCSPTVFLEPSWSSFNTGTTNGSDGSLIVRACRDLSSGEELCHNYGPDELQSWPLDRRQEFIKNELGFCCKCCRCLAESVKVQMKVRLEEQEAVDLSVMD